MSDISRTMNPASVFGPGRSDTFTGDAIAARVDYRKAGQEALGALMSVNYHAEPGQSAPAPGRPQLHPPMARDIGKAAQGDLFTLLMAMISELIGEVDINKLKSRLAMAQSLAGARQQGQEKLATQYTLAVTALETAEGEVENSQQQLEKRRERLQSVQGQRDASETRLAGLAAESPEYASELARRDRLKGELTTATQSVQTATDAHLKLIETANAAAKIAHIPQLHFLAAKTKSSRHPFSKTSITQVAHRRALGKKRCRTFRMKWVGMRSGRCF